MSRLAFLTRPFRSIRVRIVAAFVAAMVAMLGAQGFLIWQQQQITDSWKLITEGYMPLSNIVTQLEADRQRVDNDLERLLQGRPRPTTGAASATQLYTEEMRRTLREGRIHVQYARGLPLPTEQQAYLTKIDNQLQLLDTRFSDWQGRAADFVALSEAGRLEEASTLKEPLRRNGMGLADEIDTLGRLVDARVDHLTDATEAAQARARTVSLVIAALALGFSAALIVAVLYALGPIGRLTTEVQRLAAGEYGGRVDVRGGDEVAILAGEFNAMVQALQIRDRTLVERAEELNRLSRYLGSVLDSLEDALLVVEGGTVTLANPAATRIWGARTEAVPPPALAELVERPGRHEIEGPGRTLQEVRIAPFATGRTAKGVVVVAGDVTEQTRTRERLARSERLALVGQMLAQITHEVRNPLNAMSLNAELLADELAELDAERRTEAWDLLATVANEIDRLTDVTAHYLQLARRPRATLAPEDLALLVDDVARLLAAELAQHHASLQVRDAPVAAQLVDGNQLKQALLNIVRNAVEAGARQLVLEISRQDGEVRLSLSDDGPGMTAEEVEKACEPFFSSKATGTGLGLAITKQILEDHDGTVRVASDPGQGTTIVLAFPERPVEEASAPH